VLPFYAQRSLKVKNALTDNGRDFCGSESHPYRSYLSLNEIGHRTTKVRRPQTSSGFVERFNRMMLDEFFRKAFPGKLYGSVEVLQLDLDECGFTTKTGRGFTLRLPQHGKEAN
jgi:transposase InsO family protein